MMTSPLTAKTVPLNFIYLSNINIYQQLQLEEALLRADDRNWCIVNHGSQPAIVMGISGKADQLLDHQLLNEKPVPVIRRFSGGGTVFIDQQTIFVTWICNVSHSGIDCCPSKVHAWTASFYQKALPETGMQLIENDYVIGQRKFGGNAQYLSKGRWLHHSSLLWDYDPVNMLYLKMPHKIPNYRKQRSHDTFLCQLKPFFKDKEKFVEQLVTSIHKAFQVELIEAERGFEMTKLPHRKGTQHVLQ